MKNLKESSASELKECVDQLNQKHELELKEGIEEAVKKALEEAQKENQTKIEELQESYAHKLSQVD